MFFLEVSSAVLRKGGWSPALQYKQPDPAILLTYASSRFLRARRLYLDLASLRPGAGRNSHVLGGSHESEKGGASRRGEPHRHRFFPAARARERERER